MGATDFSTVSFAKNIKTAYRMAVENALFRYGNDGYTGTIAEKDGYVEMTLPPRVRASKAIQWIDAVGFENFKKVCPPKYRSWAQAKATIYNDKFAPAIVFKMIPQEAADWKAKNRYKGVRGNVYVFCGLASC